MTVHEPQLGVGGKPCEVRLTALGIRSPINILSHHRTVTLQDTQRTS